MMNLPCTKDLISTDVALNLIKLNKQYYNSNNIYHLYNNLILTMSTK